MKHTALPLLVLCGAVSLPLSAGKRITMETTDLATNKVTTQEMLVDSDRLRVNTGDTSMMFLTKGGNRMLILDKTRNEYREIDQATMDQMGQMMSNAMAQMETAMKGMSPEQRAMMEQIMKGKMPQAAAAVPQTTYTAKGSATVNGFRCTNYDATEGARKVQEICAAQPADIKFSAADFAVIQKMQDYMAGLIKAFENSPFRGAIAGAGFAPKGVNGFPVQTTSFENGKANSRQALKSVADAAFTDADFSIGSAKKVDLNLPANGAGKGKGR